MTLSSNFELSVSLSSRSLSPNHEYFNSRIKCLFSFVNVTWARSLNYDVMRLVGTIDEIINESCTCRATCIKVKWKRFSLQSRRCSMNYLFSEVARQPPATLIDYLGSLRSPLLSLFRDFSISLTMELFSQCQARDVSMDWELLSWGRMRDDARGKKSLDLFNAFFAVRFSVRNPGQPNIFLLFHCTHCEIQ